MLPNYVLGVRKRVWLVGAKSERAQKHVVGWHFYLCSNQAWAWPWLKCLAETQKMQNFPVGRISCAKTFRTECVNYSCDIYTPKVRKSLSPNICAKSAKLLSHCQQSFQTVQKLSRLIYSSVQLMLRLHAIGNFVNTRKNFGREKLSGSQWWRAYKVFVTLVPGLYSALAW